MRRAHGGLVLAAAVASLLAVLTASASGVTNSVRISPSSTAVDPPKLARVQLVAEPPSGTLAAWVVEVRFDPQVVRTDNYRCDPLDTPAGAAGAMGCEVSDTNGDGMRETVKAFGGIVYSGSGDGLSHTAVLADIEFEAVGDPGQCTDLLVNVLEFRDSSGRPAAPSASDGRICISGAPPSSPAPLPGQTPAPAGPAATPCGAAGGLGADGAAAGAGPVDPLGSTGGASAPLNSPGNQAGTDRANASDVTLADPEATADALRADRPPAAVEESPVRPATGESAGKPWLWVSLAVGVVVAGGGGLVALRLYRRRANLSEN